MSALLAGKGRGKGGSGASIRVVSFLIERADPFYYSALLSSIMRLDTARYPLACLLAIPEYRPLLSAGRPFSNFAVVSSRLRSLSVRLRTATRRTTGNYQVSFLRSGNRANSIVTEN